LRAVRHPDAAQRRHPAGLSQRRVSLAHFYDFRDTEREKIYPRAADGTVAKFDDVPARYRANGDATDPPFDRKPKEAPAMIPQDEQDIPDGYEPAE
jgi:cytochrome c peroxidase